MANYKNIIRDYNMDDLEMLQLAQVFHNNFILDKTAFTTAFPHLNDPFAVDFQTAIDMADDIPSAAEVDSEIAVITESLNAKLPLARNALQKLFTYADVAWDSVAKTNSFGKNKYDRARNSQVKMKELLELAHRQAEITANKTELITAGYSQAAIDELETLMNEIDTLNAQQEDALSERGTKTEVRIKALNAVWDYMKQINKTSKVVFVDSPAKLVLYLLYPTSSSSLSKPQNFTAVAVPGPPLNASLNWDIVVGAVDYEVEQSQVPIGQPVGTWESAAMTSDTNTMVPMIQGLRYFFRMRARNSTQVSAWSDQVFVDNN